MNYDIQGLKDKVIQQLLLIQTENQPKLQAAIEGYIINAHDRFNALLEYVADQTIDGNEKIKFLIDRLADEKKILKQEIISFIVIAEVALQAALNNVQDVLLQEVKNVLEDLEKDLDKEEE